MQRERDGRALKKKKEEIWINKLCVICLIMVRILFKNGHALFE